MLHIMIVDTDKVNRKRIKDYIYTKRTEFEVVKEVETVAEALEALDKTDINLVISELRLPSLSGYHLLKKMRYTHPETMVVLFSNFEEYEHLQHSVEEGVLDYFYKPVKHAELDRCLMKAKQLYESLNTKKTEEKRIKYQLEDAQPIFEDRFLINLVHGHMENEIEIKECFAHFGIHLTAGYAVMILKVDHYRELKLVFETYEKEIFIFKLLNKVREILNKEKTGIAFINNYDEITVILGNSPTVQQTIKLGETFQLMAKNETATTVTVGIGRMYENARDIYVSYKQANAALRHNCHLGDNSVIHIDFAEPSNQMVYRYPRRKEELLIYEVIIGNRTNVLRLTEEIFQSLKNVDTIPDKLLSKIILNIIVSINRYASEQGINLEALYAQHVSVKEISDKNDLEEAFTYLKDILMHTCDFIEDLRNKEVKRKYRLAKAYIESHFNNETLVEDLPVVVKMTFDSLNRQFILDSGLSINEHILRIRLDKAKTLLVETNYSNSEIMKMIGIKDIKYFEYLFMQKEGINTLDYRNLHKTNMSYSTINTKIPYK